MTIEEFIEARLAEDEQIARAAGEGNRARWAYEEWSPDGLAGGEVYRPDATREYNLGNGHVSRDPDYVTMDSEGLSPAVDAEEGTHIARHDPARVLRQVAALRAVVGRQAGVHRNDRGICETCRDYEFRRDYDPVPWPCPTARAIASIWGDHPDYRQEWALARVDPPIST